MDVQLSTTYPRARKLYHCVWCGEEIPVGQKHLKYVSIYEGDFNSWRAHSECEHMMDCVLDSADSFEFEEYVHRRGRTQEGIVAARLQGKSDWQY